MEKLGTLLLPLILVKLQSVSIQETTDFLPPLPPSSPPIVHLVDDPDLGDHPLDFRGNLVYSNE
jgi:hypothetical protein